MRNIRKLHLVYQTAICAFTENLSVHSFLIQQTQSFKNPQSASEEQKKNSKHFTDMIKIILSCTELYRKSFITVMYEHFVLNTIILIVVHALQSSVNLQSVKIK
jgi:hypothetical protein